MAAKEEKPLKISAVSVDKSLEDCHQSLLWKS